MKQADKRDANSMNALRRCSVAAAMILGGAVASAVELGADRPVELPMLEVTSPDRASPWYFTAFSGAEVLSRSDTLATHDFVQALSRLEQSLQAVLPADLHAQSDVPVVYILSDPRTTPLNARDVLSRYQAAESSQATAAPTGNVRFLPNLRLSDSDSRALFAIVDGTSFRAEKMILTDSHVRLVLSRRTPELPEWLIEGFARVFGDMRFDGRTVTLMEADWLSPEAAEELRINPEFPRTLLTMRGLLEAGCPRDVVSPRGAQLWRAQAALFVRWAFDGDEQRREALWTYARRAATQPADEVLFRECFGMSYADARDQLSDHLPLAIKKRTRLKLPKPQRAPDAPLRRATPGEIARLKGEWERLAMADVKRSHPDYAERYADRAWQTLMAGYELDPREPRLLATIGLYQCDAGNDGAAQTYLDAAAHAGVVRPRVYFELARIRLAKALAAPEADGGRLGEAQTAAVLEPLGAGWQQQPRLPESYMLASALWSQSAVALKAEDWDRVEEGLRLFPRNGLMHYLAAKLHALRGSRERAMALIEHSARFRSDPKLAARFEELKAWLRQDGD